MREALYAEEPIDAFRIVEVKNGKPHTLFHGLQQGSRRSRRIMRNEWLVAENRLVRDGTGPYYEGGFNVLFSREECIKYASRFKAERELRVVKIQVKGRIRPKEHSNSEVWLADKMWLDALEFKNGVIVKRG